MTNAGQIVAQIPIKDLKLIGEYTTANGPFVDDWFIVFMTSAKDWKQISEYTPGMAEVLLALGSHLEADIIGSLAWSTSWKTNIIWPKNVEGQEMWDLLTEHPTTLLGRLKKAMGIVNKQLVLTEAAASVFR
ncbi:hypothetical protein [Hymenobacter jeongseonensis]|uniref:hypothetical protein n=1 Tax=Hymenobacter jeongseonensis TaxID=2791027 RepID=UPI0018AFBFC4|nr:hypothetical protein [Hymenobacter jeongseonensis]